MTTGPEHDRWEDAAATYVLGALPEDERHGYEAHLKGCPACRDEVEDLRVAAEALPTSPPPMVPPPALKARIMAEVEREAQLLASASGAPRKAPKRDERRRFRFGGAIALPRPALGALACALLAAGVVLGGVLFSNGARTVGIDSTIPQVAGQVKIEDDGAIMTVDRLPAPPEGKVYMVWKQREDGTVEPTSTLFTPRADGKATASVAGDLDGVEKLLVNTEPPSGSPQPTSEVLMEATLT
jgi:anti-sigma-K factor RskA